MRKKITYLLGAGASFNAVPIWHQQGNTMEALGCTLKSYYEDFDSLLPIFKNMEHYGIKAREFGTIDIYARKLFLNNEVKELNNLKLALSLYLEIWENFQRIREFVIDSLHNANIIDENMNYEAIDKRYFSLLSVVTRQNNNRTGVMLDENVNFITWNYDLQLESAFESFFMNKFNSLREFDKNFKFLNDGDLSKNRVIHLNGMRGCIEDNGNFEDIIERKELRNELRGYLIELNKIYRTWNSNKNMLNSINYAWENKDERIKAACNLLQESDVLVIIGYSFPSFNKEIDYKMLESFKGAGKRIYYQDVNADESRLGFFKSLSSGQLSNIKNCSQFLLPNEYFPFKHCVRSHIY